MAEIQRLISNHFLSLKKRRRISYQKLGEIAFPAMEDPKTKAMNVCKNNIKSLDIDTMVRMSRAFGDSPTEIFSRFYHEAKSNVESGTFSAQPDNPRPKKRNAAA